MDINIIFTATAWEQYTDWQLLDKKVIIKINKLIKDITRNGLDKGEGKPERLKYRNAYSRRIDQEHRLVYNMDTNNNLVIIACKGHYTD